MEDSTQLPIVPLLYRVRGDLAGFRRDRCVSNRSSVLGQEGKALPFLGGMGQQLCVLKEEGNCPSKEAGESLVKQFACILELFRAWFGAFYGFF